MSNEGPTGTIEATEATGATGTSSITLQDLSGVEIVAPEPPKILLNDILADQALYLQQEAADRAKFAPLLNPNLDDFRRKLVGWASRNFVGPCDLVVIDITTPNICSDGFQRTFFDYIQFVSGKTVAEHMDSLRPTFPDFDVAYSYTRTQIRIGVVTKA